MKKTTFLLTVASLTTLAGFSHADDGKLSFSGYLDARLSTYSEKGISGNPESGWGIEDGAFYLNYEREKTSVVIDMPIRRYKVQDNQNPPSGTSASSPTSQLAVGFEKAQFYGKHKASDSFEIIFGQFDTIYGVELNDSKDRVFGKTGLVYDSLLPVTHTGVLLVQTMGSTFIKLLSANSNNKGTLGNDAAGDNSYEYGAAYGFSNSNYRAQLGYLSRPILKADSSAFGNRTLMDLTLGITMGQFNLDLEYGLVSNPNKNTLTSGDNTDMEAAGKGLFALMSYKISDLFTVGLRYENLTDDPASTSIKTITSAGVNLQYQVSPKHQMRTEYVSNSWQTLAGANSDSQRFNFANLFYF